MNHLKDWAPLIRQLNKMFYHIVLKKRIEHAGVDQVRMKQIQEVLCAPTCTEKGGITEVSQTF